MFILFLVLNIINLIFAVKIEQPKSIIIKAGVNTKLIIPCHFNRENSTITETNSYWFLPGPKKEYDTEVFIFPHVQPIKRNNLKKSELILIGKHSLQISGVFLNYSDTYFCHISYRILGKEKRSVTGDGTQLIVYEDPIVKINYVKKVATCIAKIGIDSNASLVWENNIISYHKIIKKDNYYEIYSKLNFNFLNYTNLNCYLYYKNQTLGYINADLTLDNTIIAIIIAVFTIIILLSFIIIVNIIIYNKKNPYYFLTNV